MQVMVDIETLDTGPFARITQIGAVAFDLDRGVEDPLEILKDPVRWLDVVVAPYPEGATNPATIAWWNDEERRVPRELIESRPHEKITDALQYLGALMKQFLGNKACVWAKPPGFDLRILREHYDMFGLEVPWRRQQEGDLRTAKWLATRIPRNRFKVPDLKDKGLINHYALHDALEQAVTAQAAYRALITEREKS